MKVKIVICLWAPKLGYMGRYSIELFPHLQHDREYSRLYLWSKRRILDNICEGIVGLKTCRTIDFEPNLLCQRAVWSGAHRYQMPYHHTEKVLFELTFHMGGIGCRKSQGCQLGWFQYVLLYCESLMPLLVVLPMLTSYTSQPDIFQACWGLFMHHFNPVPLRTYQKGWLVVHALALCHPSPCEWMVTTAQSQQLPTHRLPKYQGDFQSTSDDPWNLATMPNSWKVPPFPHFWGSPHYH